MWYRLSWLPVSFLLHVTYTLSYRKLCKVPGSCVMAERVIVTFVIVVVVIKVPNVALHFTTPAAGRRSCSVYNMCGLTPSRTRGCIICINIWTYFFYPLDCLTITGLDVTLVILFLVSHFNFLFIPCGRLSWLPVSFLLHVKYTLSYRIV